MNKSWRLIVCSCVSVMTVACIYAAEKPDAASTMVSDGGLVGHWPLNEGQGYILKDVVGGAGDGEQIGAEWAPLGEGFCLKLGAPFKGGIDLGRPNDLFSVRGADTDGYAYLRLPLRKLCVMGNQGKLWHKTISLWVKPVNGGIADPKQGLRVNLFMGGNLVLRIQDACWAGVVIGGSVSDKFILINGAPIDESKWTHLALTHDDVFARFFVDGKEMEPDEQHLITNVRWPVKEKYGSRGMYVSSSLMGAEQKFPYAGFVSDIRFYNRVFTEADAQAEYQAGMAEHKE